jgi:FAD:protein FMN transferase
MHLHKYQFVAMTTGCDLMLYDHSSQHAQRLFDAVHQNTQRLEQKYNFYAEDSWLNTTINQRQQSRVLIDKETQCILQQVQALSRQTRGAFDISLGTLARASRLHPELSRQHLQKQFAEALGPNAWRVEDDTLIFADPRTQLDLGGVVKEYAVDAASNLLAQAVGGSLVSFGGDLRARGRKPDGSSFLVGIKNPLQPSEILLSIALDDAALTTSGHYARPQWHAGEQHSHVWGAALNAQVQSATVIAEDTLSAGIWSTSLLINPSLIKTTAPSFAYVLIEDSLRIVTNLA